MEERKQLWEERGLGVEMEAGLEGARVGSVADEREAMEANDAAAAKAKAGEVVGARHGE